MVGKGEIATNQIELSPYLQNTKLAAFLKEQGITVTSYMTLAYGKVLKDPVLADIAAKHKATVAQVALAWAMQLGYAVIPPPPSPRTWPATCLPETCAGRRGHGAHRQARAQRTRGQP